MSLDITGAADTWLNVYTAAGVTPGTPIMIYNKSIWDVTAQEVASAPSAASWDGPVICRAEAWTVDQQGVTGCWVRSRGPIWLNVQVVSSA